MSKLDELIQQYCPDGVEYAKLGDFATQWYRGAGIKKDEVGQEGIPCIRYGEIHTAYKIWFDKCVSHTDEAKQPSKKYADYGDILFAITSEDIPFIGNSVAYVGKERIMVGGDIVVMKHTQNPKYISYALSTIDAVSQKGKGKVKSKVVHINVPSLKEIIIPLPPLPVQEEIVRILDNFTELQAELQAELQKRKQQYNYYLDNLLNFKNINRGGQAEVKWMKMSEVMSISRGASPRPIQNYLTDADDGIPWIKIGDVSPSSKYISSTKEKIKKEGATKSRYLKKGDFILSNSMSFGRPYILNIDGCIHDGWISMYGFEEHLDQDYLYYVLRSESVQTFWTAKANSGGAVSNLNSDIVRKTLIPIPSMAEQKRIASILDRFDRLTNDLNAGLPAEIEKRRQQYEYYRDKLLTFKRKEA